MNSQIDPVHFKNFNENLKEVEGLASIHTMIAGSTPGRKTKVQILNKSAIVLLTACWEFFVEDLIREGFDFMLSNASDHSVFPNAVLTKASAELKSSANPLEVWSLAGVGWKNVLAVYRDNSLEKEIDHFHVPRPDNIDNLYNKLLGIRDITNEWYWQKMNNQSAKDTLNRFIDLRGEIAHNVKTDSSVRKKDVDDYRNFLNKAAVILHNRVNTEIEKKIGQAPWPRKRFGEVS